MEVNLCADRDWKKVPFSIVHTQIFVRRRMLIVSVGIIISVAIPHITFIYHFMGYRMIVTRIAI